MKKSDFKVPFVIANVPADKFVTSFRRCFLYRIARLGNFQAIGNGNRILSVESYNAIAAKEVAKYNLS